MFYEAQGIGRFLVELGYWLREGKTHSATIDLLQQTPLDPAMGDLSLSTAGRFLMVEFKIAGESSSEEKKGSVRANVRRNLRQMFYDSEIRTNGDDKKMEHLREISHKCHLIADLDEDPDNDTYSAYLKTIKGIQNVPEGIRGQRRFIKKHLLKRSPRAGVSGQEFKQYLEMIYRGSAQEEAGRKPKRLSYCFHIREDGSMRWWCAPHFYPLIPQSEVSNRKEPPAPKQKLK